MADFQDFHKFLDLWEKHLNNDFSDKITSLLDGNELILFFVRDDEVFGADEDSRVMFARMKHPTPDDGKDWAKEANFAAWSLTKALNGNKSKSIFSHKDAKNINIIDRNKAEKLLSKQAEKAGGPIITSLVDIEGDIPPNMADLKDKR